MKKIDGDYIMDDYRISLENQTYLPLTNEDRIEFEYNSSIMYGGTAPRFSLDNIPEGYEEIKKYLTDLDLKESAVIEVYGVAFDGILTGYINVYKDTIGYLSGGGNYGVEEIDYSYCFSYTASTDTFEEYTKIENAMIVALCGTQVIYWKNKSYYLYNEATKEEQLLVEDKAYDSGLRHQSRTEVLTNERFTLLVMIKGNALVDDYF
ncbi:MAG: hypothetical protein K2N42_02890, partial [Anaeroplasmataceae bacterium]|nr:hypothetical protein [Anaeroplasmataceae bacterium]